MKTWKESNTEKWYTFTLSTAIGTIISAALQPYSEGSPSQTWIVLSHISAISWQKTACTILPPEFLSYVHVWLPKCNFKASPKFYNLPKDSLRHADSRQAYSSVMAELVAIISRCIAERELLFNYTLFW